MKTYLLITILLSLAVLSTKADKSVLGGALELCSKDPLTGFQRDGYCNTDESDYGTHVVCAQVTKEFLEYSKSKGNDLITPHSNQFPGLNPGDFWCLCASRWKEAYDAGIAPPVNLAATHQKALDYVTEDALKKHSPDTSSNYKVCG